MSKKLTSIRLDEKILNDFLLETAKWEELVAEVSGTPGMSYSHAQSINTTEQIHLALHFATEYMKDRNSYLRMKKDGLE